MATKTYKPITAGTRYLVTRDFSHLSTDSPEKSLLKGKNKISGRSTSSGRITVRRRGGGNKKRYRVIDFKRNKEGIGAKIASIEYDPNRSADICLVVYEDGVKSYILAPRGIQLGDTIMNGADAPPQVGNHLPFFAIPLGSVIHNIELVLGKGGVLARSAGSYATLVAKEGDYVTIKLPSGEMRVIFAKCSATIGSVGGEDHFNTSLGKAGKARILGRRPKVRGVAMNPHDHPHGGGEGKTSGGRHPVSPTGVPSKGFRTRNKRKPSNKFIVKSRHKR